MMKRFYYIAIIFYVAVVYLHISTSYSEQKEQIFSQTDSRLERYAMTANRLVGTLIHHKDMNASSVSEDEDERNREILSLLADDLKINYIYTLIKIDDRVHFSSSSATSEDLKDTQMISHYFDEYKEASQLLKSTFDTQVSSFEISQDRWGEFRSIFIPFKSSDGEVYVVGVDSDMGYINSQLDDVLKHYMIEFFIYIIAILPLFYIYYRHNQIIQSSLEDLVQKRTKQMRYLLDNVNQGFLAIDKNLTILDGYSKKCYDIFDREIKGEPLAKALYVDDDRAFISDALEMIFDEVDEVKIDSIISMLPERTIISHRAIDIDYRFIGSILVVILTDITEKINLEKKLQREHQMMRMVVGVISNSEEFYTLLDDYELFLSNRLKLIDDKKTPLENLKSIFRTIHTYKGIFSQKDFIYTPIGLHKFEDKLSQWVAGNEVTNEQIGSYLARVDFRLWLEKDLEIVATTLGDDFIGKNRNMIINKELFVAIYNKLSSMDSESGDILELADSMKSYMYKSLKECFVTFDRLLEQLAEKTDKKIETLIIEDKTYSLVDDSIRAFVKSLHHVVANSVMHGIEHPNDRVLLGKSAYGRVGIILKEDSDSFSIEICDDGVGLDDELICTKAQKYGIEIEKDNKDAISEIIFRDFFTTKDIVDSSSGRGVGLATVKEELLKLGGKYHIESSKNQGMRTIFYIPKKSLNLYSGFDEIKKRLLSTIEQSAIELMTKTLSLEITDILAVDLSKPIELDGAVIGVDGVMNCNFFIFSDYEIVDAFSSKMLDCDDIESFRAESLREMANIILGRSIESFPKRARDVIIEPPKYLAASSCSFSCDRAIGVEIKSGDMRVLIVINTNSYEVV